MPGTSAVVPVLAMRCGPFVHREIGTDAVAGAVVGELGTRPPQHLAHTLAVDLRTRWTPRGKDRSRDRDMPLGERG